MAHWIENATSAVFRRLAGSDPVFFDREASSFRVPAPTNACGGVSYADAARQPNAVLPSIERMSQPPAHRQHRWGGR
jgi:hypothetical protein